MSSKSGRKIFVNLAVRDLKASMEFFSKLGFEFNRQFSDENAACMIISEEAYVMLLVESYFQTFVEKRISDSQSTTEGIFALSCDSRSEVDELLAKALAAGGKRVKAPVDHGFMYGASFYDIDGHHWEVLWMNPSHVQPS
jgi:predicted lactoylglutathione lyase